MASRRVRVGAATLSILLHALLIWVVANWDVTPPNSEAADLDRVVVSLAKPRPAPAADAADSTSAKPPPVPETEAEPEPPEPPPANEIPLPAQQIVSMPEGGLERAPEQTRFLSARDITVEEQTMRRGEPAPSDNLDGDDTINTELESEASEPEADAPTADRPGEPPPGAAPQRDDAMASGGRDEAMRPLPDLAHLMPNALALAAEQAERAPAPAAKESSDGARQRRDRTRRAAAWQPSTRIRGTADNLPDVAPGNITLLNTKAQIFAPFVTRVAVRVFQNMMIDVRRNGPTMRPGVREVIEAEAVMSPQGHMIGLRITQRSTSMALGLDRILQEACNVAFFDRNPPPGAAADDGNYHFILQTMIQTYPGPGRININVHLGTGLL